MKTFGPLPNGLTYSLDDAEIISLIRGSGKKMMTLIGPDVLINAEVIDGALQGWIALADQSGHPVPFAYLLNAIGTKRWALKKQAISEQTLELKFLGGQITMSSNVIPSTSMISAQIARVIRGSEIIGGFQYPAVATPSGANGILDLLDNIHDAELRFDNRTVNGLLTTPRIVSFWLPILGGLTVIDTIKTVDFPGPCLVVYHNASALYPNGLNPTALPGGFTSGSWATGYYNVSSVWVPDGTTINPSYTISAIGSLTPNQLQARNYSLNGPSLMISIQDRLYDTPDFVNLGIPAADGVYPNYSRALGTHST